MPESGRIQTLRTYLAETPEDSFLRYALALELLLAGDPFSSSEEFLILKMTDPEYLATYYQLGKAFEMLGRKDDARVVYHEGISVALRQQNIHTMNELKAASEGLDPDSEENL
ncbi:MAG: tetratricopeptide repeat protein [Bacteroidia bacterium]|nr:tetratricopeptide repeat protein [Bacteroidia bacterium]